MKNIDFLPPEMLRRNEVRSLRWWWIGVCFAFGLFISTAALLQYVRRAEVQTQIARIQTLCDAARSQETLIAELKARLELETQTANLYAFLDHPWPLSQILADLIAAMPEDLMITELKISPQQFAIPQPRSVAETQVIVAPENQPELSPAAHDLKQLWDRTSSRRMVVELKGVTRDPLQLYQYVGELSDGSLIESAKLEAFEEVADQAPSGMQFTVRVIIRPAYSQPGGPTDSARADDTAVAAAGVAP